uniref:Reverse transcriptase Ty1/copia-type domain-containing protein n=1 Tax=Fagus sylvatica TaxID=28930 RepID=A0A2N9F1J7_FAGSY
MQLTRNLSSSGLAGQIAPYISNLTMIQYLDLSNNSLTGPVPDFLSNLPSLRVLNLEGNNLTGSVPAALLEKSKSGSLSLSNPITHKPKHPDNPQTQTETHLPPWTHRTSLWVGLSTWAAPVGAGSVTAQPRRDSSRAMGDSSSTFGIVMSYWWLLLLAVLLAIFWTMGDSNGKDFASSEVSVSQHTPTAPTATIATGTPTACHVRSEAPTWVLDSGANDHMTGSSPPLQVYTRRPRTQSPLPDSSLDPGSGMSPTPIVSTPPPPTSRYPSRVRQAPSRFGWLSSTNHPISQYISYFGLSDSYRAFIGKLESVSIPRSVSAALQDPKWVTAMQAEMNALQANQTWELVPLPAGEKTVGCKWVFTVKYMADSFVDRYKARLVAKGFTQVPGKDFGATFAPVAKLTSVRLLVSLAASHSWPLHQLDIKNAFLHGDLLETIYMDTPPGFRAEGEYAGKVCRLRKSLYGLKQSPRAWFSRFSEVILSMEFVRCHSDHTCFIRRRLDGCCIILLVYVDDIILTGDDAPGISQVKQDLGKVFDVKDLGSLRYFLGIEVARSRNGISLSQRKYTLDLLQDTGMLGCRPASTPMDPNLKLSTESGDLLPNPSMYQRLVGRLIYLTNTRPDLTFVVSVVSQFMHAPRTAHLDAVYHILRYLKTSPGLGLFYSAGHQSGLSCFTDADYAGSQTDRRSTTGLSTFYGNHLISWKNSVLHERSKHIEVDIHFIRKKVRSGIIIPSFVPSSEQIADVFTKPVGPSLLQSSIVKLGLIDIFAPA